MPPGGAEGCRNAPILPDSRDTVKRPLTVGQLFTLTSPEAAWSIMQPKVLGGTWPHELSGSSRIAFHAARRRARADRARPPRGPCERVRCMPAPAFTSAGAQGGRAAGAAHAAFPPLAHPRPRFRGEGPRSDAGRGRDHTASPTRPLAARPRLGFRGEGPGGDASRGRDHTASPTGPLAARPRLG